jgi:DNA-binding CsgD family transcriptional regulator
MRMFNAGSSDVAELSARSRRDEVLELVAKRRSLKQIANELGIGESTVNYHIRSLKELHGVYTLAQLADVHASRLVAAPEQDCRISSSRESAVSIGVRSLEGMAPDESEPLITFHDALNYRVDAPWIASTEPKVVPGVLDGTNAGLIRGATMVAIAVGFLALVLLGLGVAQGITAALSEIGASSASGT